MDKIKKVIVRAVIGGINDSYLGLNLGSEFCIGTLEAIPSRAFEAREVQDALFKGGIDSFLWNNNDCTTADKLHFFFVERLFDIDIPITDENTTGNVIKDYANIYFNEIENSLVTIRLFSNCNADIRKFAVFIFTDEPKISYLPFIMDMPKFSRRLTGRIDSLSQISKAELEQRIHDSQCLIQNPVIKSAFALYKHSFLCDYCEIAIVLLCTALEVLFIKKNRDRDAKKEKLAKRLAVSLEPTDNNARMIMYNEMKRLCKLRSDYIHDGEAVVQTDDVLLLRNYLRRVVCQYGFISTYDKNKNIECLKSTINNKCWEAQYV